MGHKAGATGLQGMLTSPRHLIPPPVFPGICVDPFVYLTCNCYLNFETDYSSVSWPFHVCIKKKKLTGSHQTNLPTLYSAFASVHTTEQLSNESAINP
jgi:hypothetical protein